MVPFSVYVAGIEAAKVCEKRGHIGNIADMRQTGHQRIRTRHKAGSYDAVIDRSYEVSSLEAPIQGGDDRCQTEVDSSR